MERPVHDNCNGSESQCDEETGCYGAAGVLNGDLLTEEGSPDGQVPLQLQQDQCLQEVQLHGQADSMEDTQVLVEVFLRENHRYDKDQDEHRGKKVVCLQNVTGLQVVPVSGEHFINYPGVADGYTGNTEAAHNRAVAE